MDNIYIFSTKVQNHKIRYLFRYVCYLCFAEFFLLHYLMRTSFLFSENHLWRLIIFPVVHCGSDIGNSLSQQHWRDTGSVK